MKKYFLFFSFMTMLAIQLYSLSFNFKLPNGSYDTGLDFGKFLR